MKISKFGKRHKLIYLKKLSEPQNKINFEKFMSNFIIVKLWKNKDKE